jgi:hypothetical protein
MGRRQIGLAALVAGAVLLGQTGFANSAQLTHAAPASETISFVATSRAFGLVDVLKPGPGQADYGAAHSVLQSGGRTVGHDDGLCVATYHFRQLECFVTFSLLGRGSVTTQGRVVLAETPNWLAITGGTGSFRGVGGQVRIGGNFAAESVRVTLLVQH